MDWENGYTHYVALDMRALYRKVAEGWIKPQLDAERNALPKALEGALRHLAARESWKTVVERYFDWASDCEKPDGPRDSSVERLQVDVLEA